MASSKYMQYELTPLKPKVKKNKIVAPAAKAREYNIRKIKTSNSAKDSFNQAKKAYKLAKADARKVIKDVKRQKKQAKLQLKRAKLLAKLADL